MFQCGEITEVRLVKNFKGLSKGFGYVEFTDPVSNSCHCLGVCQLGLLSSAVFVLEFGFIGPV